MPFLAKFNYAMQDLTGFAFETSEQHKELREPRVRQDKDHIEKVLTFVSDLNPFSERCGLMNLATGVESNDGNITIHNFFRIGNNLLAKMSGANIFDLKCSRKDIVKNLASMTLIKDIE